MTVSGKPLEGKDALVTGGSRGIGAAISRKLGAWGCELYVNYVERDSVARELMDELGAQDVPVRLVKADVAEPKDITRMLGEVEQHHGGLDILVHNAASTVFRTLADTTLKHWEYVINTSLRSVVLLSQAARPVMAGRGARFITMSNRNAVRHVARNAVLGAAKAAVESLTRSLSVELAPDGIVVNCVRPGTVATAVVKVRPDFGQSVEEEIEISPWRRATTPEDVANVVALLCLEEASWICGQTIVLDGGWSAWRR